MSESTAETYNCFELTFEDCAFVFGTDGFRLENLSRIREDFRLF